MINETIEKDKLGGKKQVYGEEKKCENIFLKSARMEIIENYLTEEHGSYTTFHKLDTFKILRVVFARDHNECGVFGVIEMNKFNRKLLVNVVNKLFNITTCRHLDLLQLREASRVHKLGSQITIMGHKFGYLCNYVFENGFRYVSSLHKNTKKQSKT